MSFRVKWKNYPVLYRALVDAQSHLDVLDMATLRAEFERVIVDAREDAVLKFSERLLEEAVRDKNSNG